MIASVFNQGSISVLERVVQFTSARQAVLADNIANLSTPYFKPRDVDPREFQRALGEAIDDRRQQPDGITGDLHLRDTPQIEYHAGALTLSPGSRNENITFHDRNNRDVERIMQDLAENAMTHRLAIDMLRNQFDMLRTAIRERV